VGQKRSEQRENDGFLSRTDMRHLADLTGGLILGIIVGVTSGLGAKYDEQYG